MIYDRDLDGIEDKFDSTVNYPSSKVNGLPASSSS